MSNNTNITFNAKWINTSSYVGVFEFELTNNTGEMLINPEITIDFGEDSYIEYNDGIMFTPSYGSLVGYLEEPNVANNQTVTFSVTANDSCGMSPVAYWVNGLNAINSVAGTDTDAQTKPTNLKFSSVGANSFTLSWDAPTGDVDHYDVAYQPEDDPQAALQIETTETQVTINNLMETTSYIIAIATFDTPDNWSSIVEANVTTTAQTPDTTAPTAPSNLKSANISVNSVSLSWDAATDDVGVDHYVVTYQPVGDTQAALEIQTTITSTILSNLTAETNYAITLVAVDAAGNQSPATLTTVETAKPSDDISAPSVPNGLSISAVTDTSLTLTWKASTDNVGVTGYRVKYTSANGNSVTKDVATTTCVLNSLAANTKYDCCVAAYDANNNISGYSAIITATTQAQVPATTTTSFAPYIDVTINANWATNPPGINTKLISDAISKGVKKFHLAFLVQDQTSKQLVWGNTYFPYSAVKPVCDIIHAAGGEPIAAFGGASGTDPSVTLTQTDLTNIYLNLKKDFGIQHIDFDFETAGQYNYKVAFPAALAAQKQDPTLWFSLTLPVMPTGLTGEGIAMITYAKQIGLALNVQIMAMDYGASGLDMGASAVSAIDATKNNLARIYTDKSSADLYKMIGVIPMIGQNDTAGEMFSFADATKTALYAKQQKLNLVSMWSLGRDFPGMGELSTCTQNPAQTKDYEYTTTFLSALGDDSDSESDPDEGNVFHVEQHGDPYALNDLQRRQSVPAPIQSTGYWAKAGSVLTIEYALSGNTPTDAPQIWIHCIVEGSDPAQEYYSDKQKVPLTVGINKINVAKTGVVYIASNNIPDPAVNMQITIVSGGNLMPTFVLGKDDANAKQWLKDVAQAVNKNTSPYVELVGKRMIITLPIYECKSNVTDPVAILNSWDRIIDCAEAQYGLTQNGPYPNIATAVRYHFFTKADSTGGYMSSANEWMATNQDGIKDITDNINSSWGPWHELGHQYEVLAFQTKSEVLENLTSLYVQRELGLTSRLFTDNCWENIRDYLKQSGNNYDAESDLWISVAMFWQLDLTFGKDFYQRLTDNIRMMPVSELPDDNEEKKSLFINLASKVSGFNLSPFFEQWGYRSSVHATSNTKNLKLKKLNDAIWLNEDEKILYHYPLEQQSISGRLSLPLTVDIGEEFTVQATVTNRQGAELSYNWLVPEGCELISSNGATATFRTPAACIANAYVSVTCAVSDAENTMNIGAKIQLKSSGEQRRPEVIYSDLILKRYGKDKLQTWDENNPIGTPGDIYLYHSAGSYRFFQLRNKDYWYFPTTKSSNSDWTYIGEYNMDIYLANK